jgi:hypothetical protein
MSATYIPASDFSLQASAENLGNYQWNDRLIDAIFCKTCGIHTYIGNEKYGYRINLGCVEGLDVLNLNISIIDGRSMPIADSPGPHPGDHE